MEKGQQINIGLHWKKHLQQWNKKIPSKCRIRETCFTSIAVIGGKLFSNKPKNMNSVHKDTKDLLYVMITLVTNISVGDTVIYDGVIISDLVNRAHVLKHLHGRILFLFI